ncbi:MAG: AMP-binding protein [Acidiferrobacterales bacterium]|nr:AMP-binding protein [Acidiferrobacterales bacterium]
MSIKSPLEMLYHWEKTTPDTIYLRQPINGKYREYSWADTADQVRRVASELLSLDLETGSKVAILSKNCAEWFIVDLAIMMAGHISVPIYSTAGQETIQYVIDHADCKAIFIGKLDNTADQVAAIPKNLTKFAFPYPNIPADKQWEEIIVKKPFSESPIPNMDSTMTIIYTSGSTGKPKGVVHSYASICWAGFHSIQQLDVNNKDRWMSYLPLAHITERVLIELSSIYSSSRVDFLESLETFARDINATRPTLFISVPRLWTRFQMGVLANLPQKKLDFLLKIPLVSSLISKKIRVKLGLNQARLTASGSAPISLATMQWFQNIGINISEGWGMTENSAYGTHCVPFRADKMGSIGRAYDGVDIRIADDGEIQVKAPCNMIEYYREPDKTKNAFTDDGYLHTGDKGTMDSDGYIKITGRLKEIFKTAKGKYIAPVPIESKLMANSLIEQICVTGSHLKQPIALMVLSEAAAKYSDEEVNASLLATLEEVNTTLESHAVLDALVVMQEAWTVDNKLLTPTLKVKRHVLEERFEEIINAEINERVVRI